MAAVGNITVTLTPDVIAAIDDAKNAMLPVVEASVRYFDCLSEFDDQPEVCSELAGEWDTAVIAYKARMVAE